jgi:hypothetical protein
MFGLIDSVLDLAVDVAEAAADTALSAADAAVGVVTFGEYGDASLENVAELIALGYTVSELASSFGVSELVIESLQEEGE